MIVCVQQCIIVVLYDVRTHAGLAFAFFCEYGTLRVRKGHRLAKMTNKCHIGAAQKLPDASLLELDRCLYCFLDPSCSRETHEQLKVRGVRIRVTGTLYSASKKTSKYTEPERMQCLEWLSTVRREVGKDSKHVSRFHSTQSVQDFVQY